jgi:hypothetical protein
MLQSFIFIASAGRIAASAAVVVGLAGAIISARAVVKRRRAMAALVMSAIALAIGALVAVTAPGGLGTGHGFGGAVVAVVVGSIGSVLGVVALRRSRR